MSDADCLFRSLNQTSKHHGFDLSSGPARRVTLCARATLFAYNRGAHSSLKRGDALGFLQSVSRIRPALSMPFAFLLALAAIAGATTLTYLYDRAAPFWPRL